MGNWPFFYRPDWVTGHPVERVDETLLADLSNRLNVAAIDCDVEQVGMSGKVVVPQPVMNGLKVPDPLPGFDINGD